MEKQQISRRQFIGRSAAGLSAFVLISGCGKTPSSHFFTSDEIKLVELLTEQIIPADDFPGAIDAGVVHFIDKQLVGPYKQNQNDYRKGLVCLQSTCNKMFTRTFEQLSFDEQTKTLKALESGQVDMILWPEVSPVTFFGLLREHTMQGFYGSPRHGGNKSYISYKMLDLDYPYILGQNRYKNS